MALPRPQRIVDRHARPALVAILGTERCCSSFQEAFDFLHKDVKTPQNPFGRWGV